MAALLILKSLPWTDPSVVACVDAYQNLLEQGQAPVDALMLCGIGRDGRPGSMDAFAQHLVDRNLELPGDIAAAEVTDTTAQPYNAATDGSATTDDVGGIQDAPPIFQVVGGRVQKIMGKALIGRLLKSVESRVGRPGSKEREKMPKSAFLRPSDRGYPVKVKRKGKWVYSPKLLHAAISDANRTGDKHIGDRASRILARLKKEGK